MTKFFGSTRALADVDITIDSGEVFGYLGPNGAGKSTTLRLIMGLIRPTRGSAEVLGLDCWRQAAAAQQLIGYVPGEPALYRKLTGQQHIEYLSALRRIACLPRAEQLARRLDLDLSRRAEALSKGNKQKLAIVLAMMHDPRLLVLDEPSTGLDPFARDALLGLIRSHAEHGGTVLLSSHVLDEVQRIADRVGIVRAGRLIAAERLGELRATSLHHVNARLGEPVDPAEFTGIGGILDVWISGVEVRMKAPQASLDAVLGRLIRHRIEDLSCTEADLEETFRTFYGGTDDHVERHQP
ncbi:MAG TPA: ABC transporter ATP-binding protein [Jatrophihabitans sp.]|nr:ABC transporter ATP-binding protein [Jatrophihabitans sp.]